MTYRDLSLRERALIIHTAVKNGYRDLSSILDAYNRFATGGSMDWETGYSDGDIVNTPHCALFLNGVLRDNGFLVYGDAWDLSDVDTVFNGYDESLKPKEYSRDAVMKYNRSATKNIWNNFDSKTLDKDMPYIVNMYYKGSPHLKEVYDFDGDVMGTHTGILSYEDGKWWVTHNIGSNIHREPFFDLLNSNGNWGVTTIYKPRKNTLYNKVKHYLGFANGGNLRNIEDNSLEKSPFDALDAYVDNIEPWVAGALLASGAATIAGAPTILGAIPSAAAYAGATATSGVIDAYLAIRDLYKAATDNNVEHFYLSPYLVDAGLNAASLATDAFAGKALYNLNKGVNAGIDPYYHSSKYKSYKSLGTGRGHVAAKKAAVRGAAYNKARFQAEQDAISELAKRGITSNLGNYYLEQLTNEMAKRGFGHTVKDAIDSAAKANRLNAAWLYGINALFSGRDIYKGTTE